MDDNWKKLQKEVINKDSRLMGGFEKKLTNITKAIKDPDGYNTNLASKERVETLEETQQEIKTQIEDLSINSHPPVEFTKKLQEIHDKIDAIYSIMKVLSDRINTLDYSGKVNFGDLYHATDTTKHVSVRLHRKEKEK